MCLGSLLAISLVATVRISTCQLPRRTHPCYRFQFSGAIRGHCAAIGGLLQPEWLLVNVFSKLAVQLDRLHVLLGSIDSPSASTRLWRAVLSVPFRRQVLQVIDDFSLSMSFGLGYSNCYDPTTTYFRVICYCRVV